MAKKAEVAEKVRVAPALTIVKPKVGNWPRPKTGSQFGHMGLGERVYATPLLLHRIAQFGIVLPKGAPIYDRIYVYPMAGKDQDEKIAGSKLFKPTSVINKYDAARGVIVKAGIGALEQMWSHGIELGHIVWVARLSPWERKYEGGGSEHKVLVLRASELVASEDLEMDILDGAVSFELVDGQLRYVGRDRTDPEESTAGP